MAAEENKLYFRQNEILQLLSHHILRSICKDIQSTTFFGIIVDGTQDCTGTEQESICVWFVNKVFDVKEEFVGLVSGKLHIWISPCEDDCRHAYKVAAANQ